MKGGGGCEFVREKAESVCFIQTYTAFVVRCVFLYEINYLIGCPLCYLFGHIIMLRIF
jgi:hypothetical protein